MADKYFGGVRAGATSVSWNCLLRKTSDNTEQTGKVAADVTASYWRQGGLRVAITVSDLAAVDSAYSSGGWKEVDSTNMPGIYRFDLPDAAIATGVDWVLITIKVAAVYVYAERIPLQTRTTIRKNTALSNFEFLLIQSSDHVTPATGISVTAQRSIDGGAFGAATNSATEVSNGIYKINLSAADLNGDVITFKFTGTGADARYITVATEPLG